MSNIASSADLKCWYATGSKATDISKQVVDQLGVRPIRTVDAYTELDTNTMTYTPQGLAFNVVSSSAVFDDGFSPLTTDTDGLLVLFDVVMGVALIVPGKFVATPLESHTSDPAKDIRWNMSFVMIEDDRQSIHAAPGLAGATKNVVITAAAGATITDVAAAASSVALANNGTLTIKGVAK